jgi:hypothetical protein
VWRAGTAAQNWGEAPAPQAQCAAPLGLSLSEGLGIAARRPEPAYYYWYKPENANRSGNAGHKRQHGLSCRCPNAGICGSLQLILACKCKDSVGGESAQQATYDGWPKEALLLVDCEFQDSHLHSSRFVRGFRLP